MLDLSSDRWGELSHAYGRASDVPPLLRQLEAAPPPASYQSEPWFSLWSALCHQGSVYTASYAAAPYIARACRSAPTELRWQHINLVACIEGYRNVLGGPEVPADLQVPYFAAVRELPELVTTCVVLAWDDDKTKVFTSALAIAKGHARLGMMILDLEADLKCPECGADLRTW